MDISPSHPVLDDVFARFDLGVARRAYGNHAYRVYNYARRILGHARHDDEVAIASAFHDIGIWTDGTFDYLPPSIARARAYTDEHAHGTSADRVAAIIDNHHVVRRIGAGAHADVVEAFRLADRVDVSGGWLRGGLTLTFVREVEATFPYEGFHGTLVRTALAWMMRHPLRPLPMLRLSQSSGNVR